MKHLARHTVAELLNPKDKQNASLAIDFLCKFSKALKQNSLKEINKRLSTDADDLAHFSEIIDGVLSLYSFT